MGDDRSDGASGAEPERTPIVLGLVAAPGLAEQAARQLAVELPAVLAQRYPRFQWSVVLRTEPLASTLGGEVDLLQLVREQMRHEGWQLALCLTNLPLHAGRRPLTAQASVVLGVALLSVPALGPVELDERTREAALRLIDTLVRREASSHPRPRRGRARALSRRSLVRPTAAAPLGRMDAPDANTVRYVARPAAGTLRLLLGLSRALVAALGVGAFGLTSPAIWQVADAMTWPRLLLVALGALIAITLSLIVAHGLWDRRAPLSVHDPVSLINLATACTVALGVLSLFAALLVITVTFSAALIPGTVLAAQLKHPAPVTDYLRIGWVVSALATIGGALGAALESDLAVQQAAYGLRPANHDDEGGRRPNDGGT
jgi:hypothetical protein